MRLSDVRARLRQHERRWLTVYLAAVFLVAAAFAVPQTRGRMLGLVALAVDWSERRWQLRLERGLALYQAGQFEQASEYLERLDARYPAPTVRAGLGRQREQILLTLARSYEAQGRRRRALDSYQRLADFDPRNYLNQYALAQAEVRLARSWAIPPEAAQAFQAALAINPNHLPSVRGVMAHHFERGDFAVVVRTFEQYLDAPLMQNLRVTAGDSTALIRVPIDGRDHPVRIELPRGNAGEVLLRLDGFPARIGAVRMEPVVAAGRPVGPADLPVEVEWRNMTEQGDWLVGNGPRGEALLRVPEPERVGALLVDLGLGKPVDPETWDMLGTSYANLLRPAALDSAAIRSANYPSVAVADSITPFYLD